jgi:hypothetical protein
MRSPSRACTGDARPSTAASGIGFNSVACARSYAHACSNASGNANATAQRRN